MLARRAPVRFVSTHRRYVQTRTRGGGAGKPHQGIEGITGEKFFSHIKQNLFFPTFKQLGSAVFWGPVLFWGGSYASAFVFRESVCYDRLQQVDESLYEGGAAAQILRKRSRGLAAEGELVVGSVEDVKALRKLLNNAPTGITVVVRKDESAAARYLAYALAGRPATINIRVPLRLNGTPDSLTRCLAEGLGLEFLRMRYAFADCLPSWISGSGMFASGEAHNLQMALDTVTAALEEIKGEGYRRHLPPVIVFEGLLGQLGEGGRGLLGQPQEDAIKTLLAWCWQVTTERHLAHICFTAPDRFIVDKSLLEVKRLAGRDEAAVRLWGPGAPPRESILAHLQQRMSVLLPGESKSELERLSVLCTDVLLPPGCAGDASSHVREFLHILGRDCADISPSAMGPSTAETLTRNALKQVCLQSWVVVSEAIECVLAENKETDNNAKSGSDAGMASLYLGLKGGETGMRPHEHHQNLASLFKLMRNLRESPGPLWSEVVHDIFGGDEKLVAHLIAIGVLCCEGDGGLMTQVRIGPGSPLISAIFHVLEHAPVMEEDNSTENSTENNTIGSEVLGATKLAEELRNLSSWWARLHEAETRVAALRKELSVALRALAARQTDRPASLAHRLKAQCSAAEAEILAEEEELLRQRASFRAACTAAGNNLAVYKPGRAERSLRDIIAQGCCGGGDESMLHELAASVLARVADGESGLLTAHSIQGVLAVLGRPLSVNEVRDTINLVGATGGLTVAALVSALYDTSMSLNLRDWHTRKGAAASVSETGSSAEQGHREERSSSSPEVLPKRSTSANEEGAENKESSGE